MESNKQHKQNLLSVNPIAKRANIMRHMSPVMQSASQVKAFGPNGTDPNPGLLAGIAKGGPKMVSPLHNDKKNLARKQEKLSKTRDQVNETYDKKTPHSKKENRKIEKYKKTKSQIKDLGEKTNTFV
jgi:hypothetical protein